MKKLVILILPGIFTGILFAQQPDEAAKRTLEREIKGEAYDYQYSDYLYGEAVGNVKDEAINDAKYALVSEIKKEALKHPEWQFAKSLQAKDISFNFDMIELKRGNKIRIIAYIKKDNIAVVFDNKTNANNFVEKIPTEIVQVNVEETNVSSQINTQPVTIVDNRQNTSGLLEKILNVSSINEVIKILSENKKVGKVAYGTMDKLISPEKAYLIVYKQTGEIVAILDKGRVDDRNDLLSGKTKGNEVLIQNQVIWFQIF